MFLSNMTVYNVCQGQGHGHKGNDLDIVAVMVKSGGPTGQNLIRSDKSRLFSGPKDRQWSANVFVDTTAQAELIRKSEVNYTILLMQV